ncbi:hypothetical protein HLH44_03745 [Gluconacetobacter sp. 1c LMG 22058]|uniref:Uncharacterized protein n=1 Tax=Gluconacetobacter dulcium TaxID=2729096 RepID=A0A7W4PGF8_9PROT|nr:hypothetical protein [Gluconacetobacter dulcium]MBB2196585.1 hypothetical protein [Gluconacetobacter dulcium]
MASILVNILVQHRVTGTSEESGTVIAQRTVAKQRMEMTLKVTPDAVPEAAGLGFLDLHIAIEESTRPFPEMTPEQARAWMVDLLKKIL